MANSNQQYAVLSDRDETFPAAPATLGTLRKVREIDVRSASLDDEAKAYICAIMRWDPKTTIANELDEQAYFLEIAEVLFPLAPIRKNADQIAFKEVLRAKEDFLS